MRHAREIIRLKSSCVSAHEIARRLGMARSTVRETLKRADGAGLSWPLPDDMTDGALEAALYASRRSKRGHRRIAEPDWSAVHRELKRKHVTLLILWDEYIAANPGGYSYSRFCELYRSFDKTLSVTMRQTHAAGERLFVDYAGDGAPVVIDRLTGEIRMAQIFVAVLGASSFTFAKATWTQALPDWIDAHRARLRGDRRGSRTGRARQRQDRRRQGQLLRPSGQPNLCRDGGPLWNRHPARQAQEAARQGEGRAGRPNRRALAARPAQAPGLL
jgi:hypothetical protein